MNDDFLDMLTALQNAGAEFLVVGAFAVSAHGAPRATFDMDVLVRPSRENAGRVIAALRAFGAPLAAHEITEDDFAEPGNVYQLGLPPRRIDVLTRISGVSFEEAWAGKFESSIGALQVPFLGLRELIRNKRASGRQKDLLDLELLKEQGIDVDAVAEES